MYHPEGGGRGGAASPAGAGHGARVAVGGNGSVRAGSASGDASGGLGAVWPAGGDTGHSCTRIVNRGQLNGALERAGAEILRQPQGVALKGPSGREGAGV